MITAGLDVGSVIAKGAIFDAQAQRIIGTDRMPTGYEPRQAGETVLARALQAAGKRRDEVGMIVGTGYGRIALPFADEQITEISCHARGAHYLDPDVETVIDIGGQDSKVIVLDDAGNPRDFAMNDRCAAGTGRFLEVMADALGVELDEFGAMAASSQSPAMITSVCTVFAESEVVGLISQGVPRQDIAAGLCASVAQRIAGLAASVLARGHTLLTGGVALNDGVFEALKKVMSVELTRSERPLMTGAMGAAVIAAEKVGARA